MTEQEQAYTLALGFALGRRSLCEACSAARFAAERFAEDYARTPERPDLAVAYNRWAISGAIGVQVGDHNVQNNVF